MRMRLVVVLLCGWSGIVGTGRAQPAPAASPVEARLEGSTLHDGTGRSLELGCVGRAVLAQGTRFHVACGSEGVLIIERRADGSLALTGRVVTQGDAVALFERAGKVWVETLRSSAEPITGSLTGLSGEDLEPEKQARAESAPAAGADAAEVPVGEVLELRPGGFVVSLGKADGVKVGSRIEVFTTRREALLGEDISLADTVAVGQVTAASEHKSRVELGMNERVFVHASARPTKHAVTANPVGPPRAAPIARIEAGFNPFLPVEDLGVGLVGFGRVTYHFDRPWMVGAALTPFGFSIGRGDNLSLLGGHAFGAFDHRVFALGMSLGATSAKIDGRDELRSRFALGTLVRFGAVDGAHLAVHSQFTLEEESASESAREFDFASIAARVQLPFARAVWGVARSEFDQMHYHGGLGLKLLLRGQGDRDSLFITPEVGGAVTFDGPNRGGPALGFELEWRR